MKKMILAQGGASCILVLTLLRPASAQTQFDLASDFSGSDNPNGSWSFGWMPIDNDEFHVFTSTAAAYKAGLIEWRGPFPSHNGSWPPDVIYNPGAESIKISDTTWLPHCVTFHPGRCGERSVVRWTAPFSGAAGLTATFEGRSAFATTVVQVFQNEALLFTEWVWGHGEASRISLSTNLVLKVGDIVDFRVGYGNGDWTSDTTQIRVTFHSLPAVKTLKSSLESSVPRPGRVRFIWPEVSTDYGLETANEFPAKVWSPFTNFQRTEAGALVVTMDTTNGCQFFRLRKK